MDLIDADFLIDESFPYYSDSILWELMDEVDKVGFDGLSKDNTVSIAKEYEERFEGRLQIYSERDKGIYDAMNKGIKLAKGDYVWLVNADDWIEDDVLSKIYEYHRTQVVDNNIILAGGMNIVDLVTNRILRKCSVNQSNYEKACKDLKMGLCHPATIVPKSIYATVGLYDDRYYISADIDFVLRCYRANVGIVFPQFMFTNMTNGGISNHFSISKNLHDYNIRLEKFVTEYSAFMKLWCRAKYVLKIIVLKVVGYR